MDSGAVLLKISVELRGTYSLMGIYGFLLGLHFYYQLPCPVLEFRFLGGNGEGKTGVQEWNSKP